MVIIKKLKEYMIGINKVNIEVSNTDKEISVGVFQMLNPRRIIKHYN